MLLNRRRRHLGAALLGLVMIFPRSELARANHGPGASGGGNATISGETLKPGHFEFSLREDYSQFQSFDHAAAAREAKKGGDFDALDHGFITTLDGAYGVTEDFQIGASVGYFVGHQFTGASRDDSTGAVDVSEARPSGATDLVLTAKYRILKGQPGNLAILGGVVVPIGDNDVHLGNGEAISPTDQPGTGRWGLPIGLGYSRFLTPHLTIDASVLYTLRFERADFKVGDRLDAGMALAYRLTDSIKQFPQYSVFAELNDVYLVKDQYQGQDDPNSGSNLLYFTPGLRVRFSSLAALTVAPSIPVLQNLNGDQGQIRFKMAVTLSFSF